MPCCAAAKNVKYRPPGRTLTAGAVVRAAAGVELALLPIVTGDTAVTAVVGLGDVGLAAASSGKEVGQNLDQKK